MQSVIPNPRFVVANLRWVFDGKYRNVNQGRRTSVIIVNILLTVVFKLTQINSTANTKKNLYCFIAGAATINWNASISIQLQWSMISQEFCVFVVDFDWYIKMLLSVLFDEIIFMEWRVLFDSYICYSQLWSCAHDDV